jgi:thiamine kinase-like enzyme
MENPFRQLLMESKHFLSKLDLLPKVICHGDTYPTNFILRLGIHGKVQTVALDWALMGMQPVGDDLGQFVYGAIEKLKGLEEAFVLETLFDAYLGGLQENGLQIDPIQVRFGFTTSAALRVGLFQIYLLSEEIKQTITMPEEKVRLESPEECFEVKMAREAFHLFL